MSLKAVHVFVIILSISLTFLLGYWGIRQYQASGDLPLLILGLLSLIAGIVLTVYLGWFFKKHSKLASS